MTLAKALKHFNGNQAALARAAKRDPGSVVKWKAAGRIPMLAQLQIEKSTEGKLKADSI